MATQNFLIMNLLRLITPEEIGDIATKHNGGKFLSLTELVRERVEQKIYRDFSTPDSMEEIHEAHANQAKILPFKAKVPVDPASFTNEEQVEPISLTDLAQVELNQLVQKEESRGIQHKEDENMSSFILIEKERLKRSQQSLKQKEIIDLYQKNSHVDVEQIKGSNNNLAQAREAGVLVNKKHY
ncbi:MAG: hypothetical protein ACXVLQ_08005 [Bacteriovorax sp.]